MANERREMELDRRSFMVGGAAAGLTLAAGAQTAAAEAAKVAAQGAETSRRPNVIVYIADQFRADFHRREWSELHHEYSESGCNGGTGNQLQWRDLQSARVFSVALGVDDWTLCDGDGSLA